MANSRIILSGALGLALLAALIHALYRNEEQADTGLPKPAPMSVDDENSPATTKPEGMPDRANGRAADLANVQFDINAAKSLSEYESAISSSSRLPLDKVMLRYEALYLCREAWSSTTRRNPAGMEGDELATFEAFRRVYETFCEKSTADAANAAMMASETSNRADEEYYGVVLNGTAYRKTGDEAAKAMLNAALVEATSQSALEKAVYANSNLDRTEESPIWDLGAAYSKNIPPNELVKLQRAAGNIVSCSEFGGCPPLSPRYFVHCQELSQCRAGETVEQMYVRLTAPAYLSVLRRMVVDFREQRRQR